MLDPESDRGDMTETHLCIGTLRELASRQPDASEDEIDEVLHGHLCSRLDDAARLALLEFVSDEADYEALGNPTFHAFWQRVLVVVIDKHRIMTRRSA